MNLQWYGHSCFRIEGKKNSILFDRFSKDIGLRPPRIKDNIVLVSHDHYDHNNLEGLPEDSKVINGPGEYDINEVYIQGIGSFHDNSEGNQRGLNTIFIIRLEGVSFCHMGDFGQDGLEDHQLEEIGDVDILLLPVGGKYTIDSKKAADLVRKIEPKIVIPMHYKIKDLKLDIDDEKKFVKEIGINPENIDKLKIAKKTLPIESVKLYVFND